MPINLNTATIRSESRVTLYFSVGLGAAAFTTLSYYTVASLDGIGGSPNVIGLVPIVGSPGAIDLVLDTPLVGGGQYSVSAPNVPGTDGTYTGASAVASLSFGIQPNDANVEQTSLDLDALIFDTDLVWTGGDFLEAPNGDLATIEGMANFQGALTRRFLNPSPLQWAPDWGAQAGDFVNGPRGNATVLRGALIRQAYADDRTASATVTTTFPTSSTAVFAIQVTPRGAVDSGPLAISVPIP